MADSLDDFFAKKDKKRGKDKGKAVLSAETLVRELEEGSKQANYPVRKDIKTSTVIELLGLDANDADWRDFEDIERRDYTGLKVKEMSLQEQNDEERRRLSADQTDAPIESSAWRVKSDETATTIAPVGAKQDEQEEKIDSANTEETSKEVSGQTGVESSSAEADSSKQDAPEKPGDKSESAKQKYVPPGLRNKTGDVKILEPVKLSRTRATTSTQRGGIPNIEDTSLFPSLG